MLRKFRILLWRPKQADRKHLQHSASSSERWQQAYIRESRSCEVLNRRFQSILANGWHPASNVGSRLLRHAHFPMFFLTSHLLSSRPRPSGPLASQLRRCPSLRPPGPSQTEPSYTKFQKPALSATGTSTTRATKTHTPYQTGTYTSYAIGAYEDHATGNYTYHATRTSTPKANTTFVHPGLL